MLQTWSELRKRKLKETNENSIATAVLSSIVANSFAAFGGSKNKNTTVTPEMFLPFSIEDEDSPKGRLKAEISAKTAKILIRLQKENKIPSPVLRTMLADKIFYSVIKEQAGEM